MDGLCGFRPGRADWSEMFSHAEVKECIQFGRRDLGPDLGPYTLVNASGVPERGNFGCFVKFGDGAMLFAYPEDTEMFCFKAGTGVGDVVEKVLALVSKNDWDWFDELVNRLIHLTGLSSLEEQGFDDAAQALAMEGFWALEGWRMEEGEMWLAE